VNAAHDEHPFVNFTHSMATARLLLAHAHEKGTLIEGFVLYASVIDGLLRVLVAHATAKREVDATHVLASERGADVRYLEERYFSHDETLWMDERKVYRAARTHGVLSKAEFRELEELYNFRNIVIHRFIISGITYDEIAPRLDQYEAIYNRLFAQLEAIEQPEAPLTADDIEASQARIARKLRGHEDPTGA
jgi:hypothetical protein